MLLFVLVKPEAINFKCSKSDTDFIFDFFFFNLTEGLINIFMAIIK